MQHKHTLGLQNLNQFINLRKVVRLETFAASGQPAVSLEIKFLTGCRVGISDFVEFYPRPSLTGVAVQQQ